MLRRFRLWLARVIAPRGCTFIDPVELKRIYDEDKDWEWITPPAGHGLSFWFQEEESDEQA